MVLFVTMYCMAVALVCVLSPKPKKEKLQTGCFMGMKVTF